MACLVFRAKKIAAAIILAAMLLSAAAVSSGHPVSVQTSAGSAESDGAPSDAKKDYIKWVEFNVPYLALKKALNLDVESHQSGGNLSWIDLLACLAAKYGGNFSRYKSTDMDMYVKKIQAQGVEATTQGMKYFSYYREAYSAVLGGLVGKYRVNGEEKYGLIGYSPIAKTFPYSDGDDFGAKRTYGYTRPHLGHDMMAQTGTPVIAVESGVVEALGWNQYGGWRIGIRSFDTKRYYYYAHLRQNRPYAEGLSVGKTVKAGDVIGYVGRTGYSTRENVNNIQVSHLHFGLQLIFDESQKESTNEIWVDVYPLTQLLRQHQSEVYRNPQTKEYYRTQEIEIE